MTADHVTADPSSLHRLTVCFIVVAQTDYGNEASDEAEVGEMVWVDGGRRVDLKTVVVFAGVFKQTVHWVEDLVGQEEEPLSVGGQRDMGGGRGTEVRGGSIFHPFLMNVCRHSPVHLNDS